MGKICRQFTIVVRTEERTGRLTGGWTVGTPRAGLGACVVLFDLFVNICKAWPKTLLLDPLRGVWSVSGG